MARQKTRKRASKQIKSRQKRHFWRYPLFTFLLLCAGAFLIAATFNVTADDILVKAKVPGSPVTSPPVITNLIPNQQFNAMPIYVSGTCPGNAAYVEIFDNGIMQGTAICNNGFFDPQFNLFPGKNQITAQAFNITDDPGPASLLMTVYYNPPQPPQPPHSPAQSTTAAPLTLTTAFVYKGFDVGQEVSWPVEISGGSAPYALNVDWGDGNNDVISRGSSGSFDINHTYSKPGGYKNSYTIQVKASDSSGNKAYLQFFVIVNQKQGQIAGVGNITNKPTPTLNSKGWLWYAWPAYLLIFLLVLSYWLGEREELIILKKRGLLHR
ncbi:MAG: PKD domain-containing protein [Candidatus Saccharimonadales bacterium]